MVAVFDSINQLKWMVADLVEADRQEILKHGLPPCYREYDNCQKICSCIESCKAKTIVIDEKALKRFGL